MKIFLVEDSENIREAVLRYLELEGYEVREFGSIADARRALERETPDLAILDVMLPDGDGFLLARTIRKSGDIPIVFLTARSAESDRITGLELGADDYVVKPFSPKELVLRVKAVLRRLSPGGNAGTENPADSVQFVLGDSRLAIDRRAHHIIADGSRTDLTAAEWNILLYLAERGGRVMSRLQILEACLDSVAENSERTVDTHVKNLRSKLGNPAWIETIRGFGYRFSGTAGEGRQ